jgi:hypothetical protein
MPMDYTDETLMAFADGELAPDLAAEIAAAAARDAAVAARIAVFTKTRAAVAAAMGLPAAKDIDPMIALIRDLDRKAQVPEVAETSNVMQFRPARQVPFWQLPIAASVALAVGLSAAFLLRGPAATDIANLTLTPDDEVSRVLATVASGNRENIGQGSVQIIGSFTTDDGTLCREFELDDTSGRTVVSVACRDDEAWRLQLAILAASDASGYAPASSLESLDAWLNATGASAPMSAEDEAAALEAIR